MPCKSCEETMFQHATERLTNAATAHGFELWFKRPGPVVEVLAVPSAASHGSAEDLMDSFKSQGQVGLPSHPGAVRARARTKAVLLDRIQEVGHTRYRILSSPPIEVVFIDKLM